MQTNLYDFTMSGYAVAHEFPWFPFVTMLGHCPEAFVFCCYQLVMGVEFFVAGGGCGCCSFDI